MEISYKDHFRAKSAAAYPGVRQTGPAAVIFETDDWMDALRTLENFTPDMAATDLQAAQAALCEITGDSADEKLLDAAEWFRKRPNFANARTVRNILDQVLLNQNLRTEDTEDDRTILLDDVLDYLADEGIDLKDTDPGKRSIGFQ